MTRFTLNQLFRTQLNRLGRWKSRVCLALSGSNHTEDLGILYFSFDFIWLHWAAWTDPETICQASNISNRSDNISLRLLNSNCFQNILMLYTQIEIFMTLAYVESYCFCPQGPSEWNKIKKINVPFSRFKLSWGACLWNSTKIRTWCQSVVLLYYTSINTYF